MKISGRRLMPALGVAHSTHKTRCFLTTASVFSSDRLVEDEERRWTDENIDMVALKHFPNIDKEKAMSRPILYSNWLSKVMRLHHVRNTFLCSCPSS